MRVLGGTPLHVLNAALDELGLALTNMGGYDAQTIAGAVSTSTHGSGLRWGPFPNAVRSLDLVVAGGGRFGSSRPAVPTDPASFARPELTLVQDDARFRAAICGIGTLGLIHSLVIEVREKFWLNEVRTLSTWEDVRPTLTEDGVLGEGDHYELFLNPYRRHDGSHRAARHAPRRDRAARRPARRQAASATCSPSSSHRCRSRASCCGCWRASCHRCSTKRFDSLLKDMVDDGYTNVSYKVFNIGEANHLPAYSMELGVALEGGRHLEAVDRILAIAASGRPSASSTRPRSRCASWRHRMPTPR